MLHDHDLTAEIQSILSEKLLIDVPSPDANLLEAGAVDSITLVQLLLHLEEHFGVRLALEQLDIDDFSSVQSLARLVASQRDATEAIGGPTTLEPAASKVGATG